ncbi:MAG: ABC-F family ATP-binding cassette domain-containing protein [Candidatus Obscuribacterales bacterium]
MPPLITVQSIAKSYSSRPLFKDLSFVVDEKEHTGMVGPNGAGKSTLLKILAGLTEPDIGELTRQRGLRVAYVPQDEHFPADRTIRDLLGEATTKDTETEQFERERRISMVVANAGFPDLEASAGSLSGGWRKRLSIAIQLVKAPDLLLLDEPTNHLDLHGVLWLEQLLNTSDFAYVVVTHDRMFLENVCTQIVELNPTYAEGYISIKGTYSDFLTARQEVRQAQSNLEQAIASKVRREIAWLQRGAKARQTKARGRIKEAGRLIEALDEVKTRNAMTSTADIEFSASGRKTKELLVCKGLRKSLGGKQLFGDLDIVLSPGTRIGLLGANGTGKTTLLRVLCNELAPDAGTIKRADDLRVVMFDQAREQLDQKKDLKDALCPSGDAVVYRGQSLHVATWARKFLFRTDQLRMPVSYLSGGEQARILIANLMLRPADVLILDEPTNDLDIETLEVLENSLEEFSGAVILVTHDRFMLDNVSNTILALDGKGGARFFTDYAQWESNQAAAASETDSAATSKSQKDSRQSSKGSGGAEAASTGPRKLSTGEKKELLDMENRIAAAEKELKQLESKLTDPSIASNHVRLQQIMTDVAAAQASVEKLYSRWQELEERAAAHA